MTDFTCTVRDTSVDRHDEPKTLGQVTTKSPEACISAAHGIVRKSGQSFEPSIVFETKDTKGSVVKSASGRFGGEMSGEVDFSTLDGKSGVIKRDGSITPLDRSVFIRSNPIDMPKELGNTVEKMREIAGKGCESGKANITFSGGVEVDGKGGTKLGLQFQTECVAPKTDGAQPNGASRKQRLEPMRIDPPGLNHSVS